MYCGVVYIKLAVFSYKILDSLMEEIVFCGDLLRKNCQKDTPLAQKDIFTAMQSFKDFDWPKTRASLLPN